MFEAKIIVADFVTSLAGKISAGGTTGFIQNNLDDDGVTLPTGKYYFTLDADSAQKEHITCTLTGKNMTNIKSVSRQGVETTGTVREHRIGATVSITDFAHIKTINDFASQYDGKWEGAVADFAALSAITGADGEVRVTLDDSKIYVYDLDTTTWNLAGAGGGAGTVYITTKLGTEAEGDDNKTFELNSGSFPDKKYFQVYKNGILQLEGATSDYVATNGNQAVFNNEVLDTDVITLLVISVDIYNPAIGTAIGIEENNFVSDSINYGMSPSGSIQMFAGSTAPIGWLLANGASLLRADYPALFSVIGTTYGSVDATHFTLPDLRGRVAVGKSTDTEFDNLGETGGEKTHVLTEAELASHSHTIQVYQSSSGAYTNVPQKTGEASNSGSYTSSSVGSNTAHNNLQPYITLNYIIKY